MNNMMANGDVFQLMFFLRGGISRNQVRPPLYPTHRLYIEI